VVNPVLEKSAWIGSRVSNAQARRKSPKMSTDVILVSFPLSAAAIDRFRAVRPVLSERQQRVPDVYNDRRVS